LVAARTCAGAGGATGACRRACGARERRCATERCPIGHPALHAAFMFEPEEKIHVVERRMFESDLRRHFIGEIVRASDWAVLASGHAFIYDADRDRWVRSADRRTRVVSLIDSGLLIRVVPKDTVIEDVAYEFRDRLVVTDGKFHLDINEFNLRR
jgi:hypothetical protein